MILTEFYYKKDVMKSMLWDGFGVDRDFVPMFLKDVEPLKRGEKRDITFFFNGKHYQVEIKNLNNPADRRKNDAFQIRYSPNGEFATALQNVFCSTHEYIQQERQRQEKDETRKRIFVAVPEEQREYLTIYPTEKSDVFLCVPILLEK